MKKLIKRVVMVTLAFVMMLESFQLQNSEVKADERVVVLFHNEDCWNKVSLILEGVYRNEKITLYRKKSGTKKFKKIKFNKGKFIRYSDAKNGYRIIKDSNVKLGQSYTYYIKYKNGKTATIKAKAYDEVGKFKVSKPTINTESNTITFKISNKRKKNAPLTYFKDHKERDDGSIFSTTEILYKKHSFSEEERGYEKSLNILVTKYSKDGKKWKEIPKKGVKICYKDSYYFKGTYTDEIFGTDLFSTTDTKGNKIIFNAKEKDIITNSDFELRASYTIHYGTEDDPNGIINLAKGTAKFTRTK